MGTTTLGVFALIASVILPQLTLLLRDFKQWRQHLSRILSVGARITLSIWLVAYFVAVATTIYRDHLFLVSENRRLQTDIKTLQDENEQLKKAPKALSGSVQENLTTRDTVNHAKKSERGVTPAQKITAIRSLMSYFMYAHVNGSVTIQSLVGDDEALAFSFQLADVFRSGGWTVKSGEVSSRFWTKYTDLPPVGVIISTNKPDYEFLAVQSALVAAGVVPKTDIQGVNVKPLDGINVLVGANK
jgi:hypothetical protein